jgi:hypothetical protein
MATTLDQITSALGTGGNAMAQNWLPLLITYLLGQQESAQQKKEAVTPQNALNQLTTTKNNYADMFNQSQQGLTQNPMLTQARNNMQARVNTPVQSPGVFNPYASNPNYGQVDQSLMNAAKSTALGQNTNPIISQGNNQLMQALQNRFGTRSRTTGTLTPSAILGAQKPATTAPTTASNFQLPNPVQPAMNNSQTQAFNNFTSQASRAKPSSQWTFQEWTQYAADGTVPMMNG